MSRRLQQFLSGAMAAGFLFGSIPQPAMTAREYRAQVLQAVTKPPIAQTSSRTSAPASAKSSAATLKTAQSMPKAASASAPGSNPLPTPVDTCAAYLKDQKKASALQDALSQVAAQYGVAATLKSRTTASLQAYCAQVLVGASAAVAAEILTRTFASFPAPALIAGLQNFSTVLSHLYTGEIPAIAALLPLVAFNPSVTAQYIFARATPMIPPAGFLLADANPPKTGGLPIGVGGFGEVFEKENKKIDETIAARKISIEGLKKLLERQRGDLERAKNDLEAKKKALSEITLEGQIGSDADKKAKQKILAPFEEAANVAQDELQKTQDLIEATEFEIEILSLQKTVKYTIERCTLSNPGEAGIIYGKLKSLLFGRISKEIAAIMRDAEAQRDALAAEARRKATSSKIGDFFLGVVAEGKSYALDFGIAQVRVLLGEFEKWSNCQYSDIFEAYDAMGTSGMWGIIRGRLDKAGVTDLLRLVADGEQKFYDKKNPKSETSILSLAVALHANIKGLLGKLDGIKDLAKGLFDKDDNSLENVSSKAQHIAASYVSCERDDLDAVMAAMRDEVNNAAKAAMKKEIAAQAKLADARLSSEDIDNLLDNAFQSAGSLEGVAAVLASELLDAAYPYKDENKNLQLRSDIKARIDTAVAKYASLLSAVDDFLKKIKEDLPKKKAAKMKIDKIQKDLEASKKELEEKMQEVRNKAGEIMTF